MSTDYVNRRGTVNYHQRRALNPWTGPGPSIMSMSNNHISNICDCNLHPISRCPAIHSDEQRGGDNASQSSCTHPFFVQSEGGTQPTLSVFFYLGLESKATLGHVTTVGMKSKHSTSHVASVMLYAIRECDAVTSTVKSRSRNPGCVRHTTPVHKAAPNKQQKKNNSLPRTKHVLFASGN